VLASHLNEAVGGDMAHDDAGRRQRLHRGADGGVADEGGVLRNLDRAVLGEKRGERLNVAGVCMDAILRLQTRAGVFDEEPLDFAHQFTCLSLSAQYGARRSFLSTFPVALRGRASMKS